MQKGFGLVGLFRGFYCIALTVANTGATLLRTTPLDTGANIMNDVAKGRHFKKSLGKWGKQGGIQFLNKVKTQMGGDQNRKRKSVIKYFDHSRSKKRRVSKKAKGIKGVPAFQVRQLQPMQVYRDIFSYT